MEPEVDLHKITEAEVKTNVEEVKAVRQCIAVYDDVVHRQVVRSAHLVACYVVNHQIEVLVGDVAVN